MVLPEVDLRHLNFRSVVTVNLKSSRCVIRLGYQVQGRGDGAGCRCWLSRLLTPAPCAARDPEHWAVGIVALRSRLWLSQLRVSVVQFTHRWLSNYVLLRKPKIRNLDQKSRLDLNLYPLNQVHN
jgi:hypothetical protein